MERRHLERFIEFILIGIVLGVTEDLIAVKLATGEPITLKMILVIVAVSIPFAAFSELVVDKEDFQMVEKLENIIK